MSKKLRILSLILALLMVASVFVACGQVDEPGAETQAPGTLGNETDVVTDPVEDEGTTPVTEATPDNSTTEEKGGCGSSVAIGGALAITVLLSMGAVSLRKKED